jgi:hypothetical protein
MTEGELQHAIRIALGKEPDLVLWRNNCGVAKGPSGMIRYGLAVGSSDLVGMIGARFAAIEIKTPKGRLSPEQGMFLSLVASRGGFAAVVRSVDDAWAALAAARAGETRWGLL